MKSSRLFIFLSLALIAAPFFVHAEDFVPLTSIPAFEGISTSEGVAEFLNNLYRIAVGAAAVLAVLQLVRAGITYMGGDSITEKKAAKDLIWKSLLGLLLVLSPAIVFGIVDPRILELNVDVKKLEPEPVALPTPTRQDAPATYNPSTQPGNFGVMTTSAGTKYYFNIPTNAGERVLVLSRTNTADSCLALAYKRYSDEATCTDGKGALQASHAGWNTLAECDAAPLGGSYLPIQSEDALCGDVEVMP